jgi:hypothetical protein
MTKVYDVANHKQFINTILEDAKFSRFSKITIKNAHLVGRELDYILLYWKRKNSILESVIIEEAFPSHRLLVDKDWIQIKTIKNIFDIDITPLVDAIKTKNKDDIRNWCLTMFSSGYDPIYWIELLPESWQEKLKEPLQIWFDIVWYNNTQEWMKQVIFWYSNLWLKLADAHSPLTPLY